MSILKTITLAIASIVVLLVAGCSKSDDQKDFENEAYSAPANYTAMNANGQKLGSNQTDPDDWRISPMYQGLIEISTPAYPNPVNLNSSLRIDIDIKGFESVPGLQIFVFHDTQELFGPIAQFDQSELNPGLKVLVLNPANLSSSGTTQGASGLNRIVLFDGRDNVISYGDVLVE